MLFDFIIPLLITAAMYMAFPLIRLWGNHGRFEKKRAQKIALWNSIIVAIIDLILTIVLTNSADNWKPFPACIYYGINILILTNKKTTQNATNTTKTTSRKKKTGKQVCEVAIAIFLLFFQGFSLLGHILSGSLSSVFSDNNIFFFIGFFLPTIIAIILLIAAHNETKSKCESEQLESNQVQQNLLIAENYKYIKPFFDTNFGTDGVSSTRKYIEHQIALAIDNHHVTRKTELMKIIFGDISNRFQNSSSINVDLVIGSFYQIAFDTIIAYNNDTDDFNILYSNYKRFGMVNPNVHKYLQMLVKIQSFIDNAFVSMANKNEGNGACAEDMRLQIMCELIAYADDNSDWNRLAKTK